MSAWEATPRWSGWTDGIAAAVVAGELAGTVPLTAVAGVTALLPPLLMLAAAAAAFGSWPRREKALMLASTVGLDHAVFGCGRPSAWIIRRPTAACGEVARWRAGVRWPWLE
jgi:hypothetical protein